MQNFNHLITTITTNLPSMKKQSIYNIVTIALLFLGSSNAFALSSDIKKPIEIDANSALFDKAKGYGKYEGNVQIKQGSMLIQAWRIEVFAPKNNITKIVALGSPIKFRQRMDDGKLAQGQAKKMTYLIRDRVISLSGGASLSQDQDRFTSNVITYSLRTGELKAGHVDRKDHKRNGRVKAIFYPSN